MTGVSHREPGAATAILMSKSISAEIIADGIHVDPAVIRLTLQVKGADRIILITDSMRAQGCGDGEFKIGGQIAYVQGQEARLVNGTLAGSVLTMNRALGNMIKFTGCSIVDAAKMAATNPAKQLGLTEITGSIEVGKQANLTVLDEQYQVVNTYMFH